MKKLNWIVVLCGMAIGGMLGSAPSQAEGLLTSTYFGGSHREWGFLQSAVFQAPDETIYVATPAKSTDFPVPATAFQPSSGGQTDILLARFSSDLTRLLAATYIGGSSGETLGRNQVMQTDSSGNLYLIFETQSADLPVLPSSFDGTINGDKDTAIIKLDANLQTLLGMTYLGGSDFETVSEVQLIDDSALLVSGWTRSADFPTTPGAWDESYNGTGPYIWGGDLFIARFDTGLSQLEASTFLGGTGWEYGGAMALDGTGNIVITTATASADFPTTSGAYAETHSGTSSGTGSDVAVTRLSPDLTMLLQSTFLGGSLDDWGYALAIAPAGDIYVTGHTSSEDFPVTAGCYDSSFNGISGVDEGDDVMIARLSADLGQLLAATYIGGTHWDCANWLGCMADGAVIVAGHAASVDFPVTSDTFQPFYAGGSTDWEGDVFLARFNGALTEYQAGSFFGGDDIEGVGSGCITLDGAVCVSGFTRSESLPGSSTGYDPTYNAGAGPASQGDCFVMKVDSELIGDPVSTPTPVPTATETPSVTATPTATATPEETWYELSMVDVDLRAGDLFQLSRHCGNPDISSQAVDEFIILDIMGLYWYWPQWEETVAWSTWTMAPESNNTDEILTFTWPEVEGSLDGIRFWGAFLQEGTDQLITYTWIDWKFS